MEKVEFVVVGAGLSGLATAMVLAEAGAEVLVVERGDYPGSKNVSGGRLYLGPIRALLPDLWGDAPLERRVVKERLTMMAPQSSVMVELNSERFRQPPYPSYTLLRATFDRWFADQAVERGALVIPGYKVDELIMEDGKVAGVISSGDEIHANAVVAADGALSFIAQNAGLSTRAAVKDSAVAVKEVIELPSEAIEERFGLLNGEGAAQLFFGSITEEASGGGFLYTNKDSLSLGLVLGMHDWIDKSDSEQQRGLAPESLNEVLEAFKARSEIRPLIDRGHTVEYSAHVIPEGGFRSLSRFVTDGMVVVGDAAGLTLNMGVTVRGMDFALASGVMAGRALLHARDQNDFSHKNLEMYEAALKESFVWQDLKTFQNMPDFLSNQRLYTLYPTVAAELLEQMMWIGERPKERFSKTLLRTIRKKLANVGVVKDLLDVRKI